MTQPDPGWLMAVDGTGLYVRASRAARKVGLTAEDGTPTGPLTLFANMLSAMVRPVQPTHLVIAWDSGRPEWRRELCPEYKTNRGSDGWGDERDWVLRFGPVREFCDAAAISQWALDGFEADDLLAAACRLSARDLPGVPVLVCSDDKDVHQLAERGRVWVRQFGKDAEAYSAEMLEQFWGVPPRRLPLLRALEGDPSDGVPGLRGVGSVTALRMIRALGGSSPDDILPPGPARDQVTAWLSVMDLNDPPRAPEREDATGILDIAKTDWKHGNVLPVLERYNMSSLAQRAKNGGLW
jgi:DNA polymerase I